MLDKELQDKIIKIANYYQSKYQEKKLIEELGELLIEISKNMINNNVSENTLSELVDVNILIYQLIHLYGLESNYRDVMEYKLNRQVLRINNQ